METKGQRFGLFLMGLVWLVLAIPDVPGADTPEAFAAAILFVLFITGGVIFVVDEPLRKP